MKRRALGFTLVELMVTVAIMAVLALGAVPLGELVVQRGKEQALRTALRDIRLAIDAYKRATEEGRVAKAADATGYPPNLSVLVDGVTDAKDPAKGKIYFLRRLPREPMSGQSGQAGDSAAASWGLRSYESPPDNPQPGKDVYDVHCRCEGVGLNGVPYREW